MRTPGQHINHTATIATLLMLRLLLSKHTYAKVVQNKMIRYVLNYSIRRHLVANDFNEVKWMSIENRIKYLAASHVFNCINEQAPEYLQVFERVNESHHYNTRPSINALILPKVGSYGIKSFHYIGAKIWNFLPDEIQTTFSKSLF